MAEILGKNQRRLVVLASVELEECVLRVTLKEQEPQKFIREIRQGERMADSVVEPHTGDNTCIIDLFCVPH